MEDSFNKNLEEDKFEDNDNLDDQFDFQEGDDDQQNDEFNED